MKRILIFIMVAAMLLVALAGCSSKGPENTPVNTQGSASPSASATPAALQKVLTSGQTVAQTAVPLIAGEQLGIFKDLGLEVERLHYISGPPQLEALPSGDWNIGWIGVTASNTGILKYNTMVIGVAGFDYTNACYVRDDSDIYKAGAGLVPGTTDLYGTADNWRGKTILVAKGTVHYLGFMMGLKALGLTENDVNIVNMEINAALQAFQAGQGDVFVGASKYALDAEKLGFKRVESMAGLGNAMPGVIITTPEYAKANSDIVVKYLQASIETMLWLADEKNIDQAAQMYVQLLSEETGTELKIEDAKANLKMISFKGLDYFEELCQKDADGLTGLQKAYKTWFEYHVQIGLAKAEDTDTILKAIDTTYLEQAVNNIKAGTK